MMMDTRNLWSQIMFLKKTCATFRVENKYLSKEKCEIDIVYYDSYHIESIGPRKSYEIHKNIFLYSHQNVKRLK